MAAAAGSVPIHRWRISTFVKHSSRFLGLPLPRPVAGEHASLVIEFQNLGDIEVGNRFTEVVVEWSDGTEFSKDGQLGHLTSPTGPNPIDSRSFFGPFPLTIRSAGLATIYLGMALGLTVPEATAAVFEDTWGNRIPYEVYTQRFRLASFTATSRSLIYTKLSLAIGILTLATVILTRVFFR